MQKTTLFTLLAAPLLLAGCANSAVVAAIKDKGASVIEAVATKQCDTPDIVRLGEQTLVYDATKAKRDDGKGIVVQFYCPDDGGYDQKVAEVEARSEIKACFSGDVNKTAVCVQEVLTAYGIKVDGFKVQDGYLQIKLPQSE